MKRRIFSILFALVLLAGLSLIPATALGQDGSSSYHPPCSFATAAAGTAQWTHDQFVDGDYSVKLGVTTFVGDLMNDLGRVNVYTVPTPLVDLESNPTFFARGVIEASEGSGPGPTTENHGPYLNVMLDTDGDFSTVEAWLEGAIANVVSGEEYDPDNFVEVESYYYGLDGVYPGGDYKSLDESKAFLEETYPEKTYTVVGVQIMHGWTWFVDPNQVVYIDNVQVNDALYDLEPMLLTAEWYKTGDSVGVAVFNGYATGTTIAIFATSTTLGTEGKITVALTNTGDPPGVFTGGFALVGTSPGPGQLLANEGDTITVKCTSNWGTGSQTLDWADPPSATVDDTDPVVTITAPGDGDDVAGDTVNIDATVVETNPYTLSVKIDGEEVATSLPYTWDTTAEDDGAYSIEVSATDLAGNSGSDSIDVTVDNTAPVITDQASDPEVILPSVATEVIFTATVTDVTSCVASVKINLSPVGGGAAVAMLDDGEAPDETADDDIFTASADITKSDEDDYDLTITATDEAGNSNTSTITLGVWLDIVDPVITNPAITYEYGSSVQPGENVIISATVTDETLMGTVTAACDAFTAPIDLLDNGVDPDATEGDNIYTREAEVAAGTAQDDYTITITAKDASGNTATDDSLELAVRSGATGYELGLVEGWNLISLPLIPNDSDISAVISADTLDSGDVSSIGIVRAYDPATGTFPYYIPESSSGDLAEMEDGAGYWIFMEADDTLTITGHKWPVPPAVPPSYDVVVGWNLIGFKSMANDSDTNYLANIAGTYPVLWSYDATSGVYTNVKGVADGMEVGHGFWIWITEAGTIVPPQ